MMMAHRINGAPVAGPSSTGACRSKPAVSIRPSVRARDSKDAAAELENFGAAMRNRLDATKTTADSAATVPVTLSTVASVSSMDSLGSKDGVILELDKDTFYPYLESQRDRLVVVDFYTQWCGPCKAIYPKLKALAEERTEISFVKFDCNKNNKEIGQALGIKVAPTFFLYRNNEKLAQMTGADINKLTNLINEHATVKATA